MTSNLAGRLSQHRRGVYPGSFTHRYNITRLVYVEAAPTAWAAIRREKQLKGWSREKKVRLIECRNPGWEDLSAASGLVE